MSNSGVSRIYRQIAGLDSPTDVSASPEAAEPQPGPEVEVVVPAEPEPVAEVVDEDGVPLDEPTPEAEATDTES